MKNAFVLMRVFNPVISGMDNMDKVLNENGSRHNGKTGALELKFLERFERAIISVKVNGASLIICDDTPKHCMEAWEQHNSKLMQILKKNGFNNDEENKNLFFVEDYDGGKGSSMAQWKLRKYFLELTEGNDDAFAVLLDQDDALYCDAIKRISEKMCHNAIVVSRFRIMGETERNIIGDGGVGHNTVTGYGRWFSHVLRMYPHKLSTIGWTKAYSRYAMNCMVSDFESFFEARQKNICDFFIEHKAYEDFLDFYMLMRKDICLRSCKLTHMYYKHADSITAKPNIDAFKSDRTIMLVTLAEMCEFKKNVLRPEWKKNLVDFLDVKIGEIEGILEKNRIKAANGDRMMKPFINETYEGWFTECLGSKNSYIKQAVNRWKEVFYLNKKKDWYENKDLIWERLIKSIKNFKHKRKCAAEAKKARTPKERQLHNNKIHIIIGFVCFVIATLMFLSPCFFDLKQECGGYKIFIQDKIEYGRVIEIISIFITIFGTFISVMLELRKHLEIKAEEETSLRTLYFAEFNDLIRHLEANLLVTIEMSLQMKNGIKDMTPMNIHFENLKWPEKSVLFMEKIATIIDKSKVDDFSRLRLNIRNMNNSAEWLKNYCNSESYTKEKMMEMINWEIWRMMAYYVNFVYMRDHNFNFATPEQLDMYLSYPETKEKLCNLFLSVEGRDKRMEMAASYIEMYYQDRRIRRKVVFQ